MADSKILLTGATGYIGGAILDAFLSSEGGIFDRSNISCLGRGENSAHSLVGKGVNIILFNSLDETNFLARAASQHDIVIHAASGFHTLSARALVLGLAQRKKQTGREVHYIHTSGTSNVADQPLTKRYAENGYPFSDKEDIFSYEKMRDEITPYAQRTSDIVATEVGQEYDVNTYILMSPSIFGTSTNPLHEFAQTSGLIRASLKLGQTPVVGDGSATWDHVHIIDVARLYKLIVTKILNGVAIPKGKKGIYFVQSGHHSWLELSQRVAEAGFALGALKTTELRSLSLEESTEYLGRGSRLLAEIGWASNSRTQGFLAREIGWEPLKTRADFEAHFVENWEAILATIRQQ